jgi:hypothetical protein
MLGERLGQNGFNDDRLPRVRDEDAIGTLIIPAFFNVKKSSGRIINSNIAI